MFYIIAIAVAVVIIATIIVLQDNKRKKTLLAKAEQGDIKAQFEVYQMYNTKRAKSGEAMQFLEKSAENGYIEAQVEIGRKFMHGNGIEKNLSKAIDWFKKAAEHESADAQYELGCCYMMGEGIEKDSVKAFNWFEKSSEQEHANAQYKLGLCYLRGDGVEEDRDKAIYWCKKAATNGLEKAQAISGFREIEKAHEIIRGNYIAAINDCCIDLVKAGYEEASCKLLKDGDYSDVRINMWKEKDKNCCVKIISGTRSISVYTYASVIHLENAHNHMIHLDKYAIQIKSNVPCTEEVPASLTICAIVFITRGFRISYPEWIEECNCPEAKQYVNTAFREIAEVSRSIFGE